MTQTVGLQRGTTTVTPNGNNTVTLFTQSGGTATRVIPSQLCFYATSSANSANQIMVRLTTSGGQTSIIGVARISSAGGFYAWQFTITGSPNNNFVGTGGLSGYGSFLNSNVNLSQASTVGDMGSATPSSIALNYSDSGTQRNIFLPSNFWMGPGDSISIKPFWQNVSGKSVSYPTLNISYSFVTITES